MRGGWQGSGTWWTEGGMDPAVVIGLVVVLAVIGIVEWIASHFWELVAGTVGAAILTGAAVVWLMRWTARREAAWGARRTALRAERAGIDELPPLPVSRQNLAQLSLGRICPHSTPVPDTQAIEGGLHIHLHGTDAAEQADIIRRAIGGE